MKDMLWKIFEILNLMKDFKVGYDPQNEKMLIEFKGERYVVEGHKVEYPSADMVEDLRRIKYL